jgi:ammonium transporter, Amt family
MGGVSFSSQLAGSLAAAAYAFAIGGVVYFIINKTIGFRLSEQQEMVGADLAIHSIDAYPEESVQVGQG